MSNAVSIDALEQEVADALAHEPEPATVAAIENLGPSRTSDYEKKMHRLGQHWRGELATPAPHDHLSDTRMAIICALWKRRFEPGEIFAALQDSDWWPDLVRRKGEQHAERLIATEIAKAQARIVQFPPDDDPTPITFGRKGPVVAATDPEPERQRDARLENLSDVGMVQYLVARYGHDMRYVSGQGWRVWDGRRWQRDPDQLGVERFVHQAIRDLRHDAADEQDSDRAKALFAFALKCEDNRRVLGIARQARSHPSVAAELADFDRDPLLLNGANGTIDLRTGGLRQHRRKDMITRLSPTAYDQEATAPRWLRFLEEGLPDAAVRAYMQRLVGHAATGDASYKALPFLWGAGNNGKTVLIKTILAALGADYARMAAPGLLIRKRQDSHPTELADLHGARLVVSVEVDEGRAFAEAVLKQLTGADKIKGRYMGRDFFEWDNTADIWLVANDKPVVRGADTAIWDRLKVIPFTVTIPADKRDPHLADKLRAEVPGILNWIIAGCLDWQRNGMQEPDAVRVAVEEYRIESDVLGPFVEQCCTLAPGHSVRAAVLYKAYTAWAEREGLRDHEVLTSTKFGTRMATAVSGVEKKRDSSGVIYCGIRALIRATPDE